MKPKLEIASESDPKDVAADNKGEEVMSIAKPSAFSLKNFETKRAATTANVATLPQALPHYKISEAKDFVRLHPEEDYWSRELCFVNVPIKGQKHDTMHLIFEELAVQFLPSGRIQRFSLVLATKPFDVFFLAHLPTRNEDNSWNASNLRACEQAKALWVWASSRKEEGVESYDIKVARDQDAFPEPKWPTQDLSELIGNAFAGRVIDSEDHPALLRLIGAKQLVS